MAPSSCKRHENEADYHYETPDDTPLASGSDWKLNLCHTASLSNVSVEGFQLGHDCSLLIELETPLPLEQVEDSLIRPLWTLLTFCVGSDVGMENLKAKVPGSGQWLEIGRHRSSYRAKDKIITEPFMLLSIRQIGNRVGDLVDRWLSLEGDVARAVSLLVGLIIESQAHVDLRFLAAAQALEALARTGVRTEELDSDEFQRRLGIVSESITDTKVRSWATRHLKHANQRHFLDLVRDLVADVGDYADGMASAKQSLLNDIRDNRNFYTYRDSRRAKRILEGEELFVLTEGVVLLLKAALLRRLGFTQGEVKDIMGDCQDCVQWRDRVAERYPVDGVSSGG